MWRSMHSNKVAQSVGAELGIVSDSGDTVTLAVDKLNCCLNQV